jgi:hypothetical protein
VIDPSGSVRVTRRQNASADTEREGRGNQGKAAAVEKPVFVFHWVLFSI